MADNACSKTAIPVASQKYSLKEPVKPANRMTRKELEEAVVSLREKNGKLNSAMAGLRYKLGKAQKKIKSYQLASKTRRLVQEASERTGRPPINKKPWLGNSKEEEERSQNIMKPVLATRSQKETKIETDNGEGFDNYSTMSLFKSPSAALLVEREKTRATSAFGGGAPRVPKKKIKKKRAMQLGSLFIDIEPLAPSKLKTMLSNETEGSRRYNHSSHTRDRLQRRPKSASASTARKRIEQIKEGYSNMSKEQASVHLATMDMPFAKRTMDSRLRKNRDKRMKNKKKKKLVTGPAPYDDVTSMFMVKR